MSEYKPTEQQQAVIDFIKGQATVSACPGSGKTQTLVRRTEVLPGDERKQVLAFNREAASDFKSKLGSVEQADVRTFHSFCTLDIMKNYGDYGFTCPPDFQKGGIFKAICQANDSQAKSWKEAGWDDELIKMAEHRLYDKDLAQRRANARKNMEDEEEKTFDALINYRQWLIGNNLLTYDSCVRLVAEYRETLQCHTEHLMVDEYQDVDQFQFDIITHIANSPSLRSFVVVGDPNQRIYEWRGALENAFSEVHRMFPDCKTFDMTINFRSYDEIIQHAETICPVGMTGVRGSGPDAFMEASTQEPKKKLIQLLTGRKEFGLYDYLADNAILCRYNRDCFKWQIELVKNSIASYIIGKGDFWNLKHVKYATKAREWKWSISRLTESPNWQRMLEGSMYKDNPSKGAEAAADARWVMEMSEEDMKIAVAGAQAANGIRISTIHKTKGKEFKRVIVNGVDKKLRGDRFVFYVGSTRAKDRVLLAIEHDGHDILEDDGHDELETPIDGKLSW